MSQLGTRGMVHFGSAPGTTYDSEPAETDHKPVIHFGSTSSSSLTSP